MKKEIRLAVLDLGSNSVRMEIYRILSNGYYESLRQEKRLVRLSEKMGEERVLQEIPIQRTLNALKEFREILQAGRVDEVRALATEAVRRAANRESFLKRVREETGFSFRVIRGEEEARYDCLGVAFSLKINNYIMIDTGGGSVELAWVVRGKMQQAVSLPLGSVVLSEKWKLSGRMTPGQCFDVMTDVARAFQKVPWLPQAKKLNIVLLGGANRMLGRIHMLENNPNCKTLHDYAIPKDDIFALYRKMLNTDTEQRKAMPGMEAERADIIIGGLTPLVVLLLYLESEKTIVCLEGLRMGVFQDFYQGLKEKGFF